MTNAFNIGRIRSHNTIFNVFFYLILIFHPYTAFAAAEECPLSQPVAHDITADPFYTDKNYSIPDETIIARNKTLLENLSRSVNSIVRFANLYERSGAAGNADCALNLLVRQAEGRAMLGHMSSIQASYQRKWHTIAVAISYLSVKVRGTPAQRSTIESWLSELADRVEEIDPKSSQWNNHHYWAGLVATAVGAATSNQARITLGRQAFDDGLSSIQPDGTLPQEMVRRRMALGYHAFALAPLVMMAEIAAREGEDWYGRRDGAIHRLVARLAAGMANPAWFDERSGATNIVPEGPILAWRAFYDRRFPGRFAFPPSGPCRYTFLGGDLDVLAKSWLPAADRLRLSGCLAPTPP
ncbi:alginate lyase family protein [Xanthobacter flavus]|uniref:alginate lyase family protein n=1 Tax=Xanthobacter flavus TaxID=281 RepID=UPI0037267E46